MTALKQHDEDGVLILELGRADRGNALDRVLQRDLAAAWAAFEDDDSLRVAVLRGAADVFSIGHDVSELAADPKMSPLPDPALFPLSLSKPVIAAVEGPCYGLGFELALACDLRVAGDGSMFGFADANLCVPYRLASVLLPRMTFLGAGLDLIFDGRLAGADEMRELGLVSDTVGKGASAERAVELARGMVRRFGAAGSFRKQAIWQLSGIPLAAAMQMARPVR